jgi:hypothetical protein
MTLQIDTKFKKNLTIGVQKKQKHWRIGETSHKINFIVPAEDHAELIDVNHPNHKNRQIYSSVISPLVFH